MTEQPALVVKGRGIVTICLMVSTLMQSLDSTIANVALPYMQGSLSASYDEVTWVLTSYVVMAAIMTAPVGWMATRFGRKNLLIVCIVGFTITSMMCGLAQGLVEMVIDRILQGAFGAALVPLSQSTMMDIYPPDQRGMTMSLWGMGVMVGPILGPTLGGFLTEHLTWRYVFFVNLPFGVFATLGLLFLMPKRAKRPPSGRFDWLGFGVLSLGLGGLQIGLDRGQELDWLSSNFIVACFILSGLGFYLFITHMLTSRNPFIPRSVFADRNLVVGLVAMFFVGVVLLASTTLMAPFLENLGGYPVETAGLIMAPRGFGTMFAMFLAGRLLTRIDPRLLIITGYLMLGISLEMQSFWTPDTGIPYMAFTIVIQGMAMGFVFVSLQVVSFYTLKPELRTQGTSLLNLIRNVGSAIGISVTTALLTHMTQSIHANLMQFITPFWRPLQVGGSVSYLLNPHLPGGAALLNQVVTGQAEIIAYMNDFKFMAIATIPAIACVLLMRGPPVAFMKDDPDGVPVMD